MLNRILVTAVLFWGAAGAPLSASPMSPLPEGSQADDLDEVDDIAGDDDILPRNASGESDVESRMQKINRSQDLELKLSHDEIRAKRTYAAAVALGSSKPWQAYNLELGFLMPPSRMVTVFAGGGPQRFEGVVEEKSYDMEVNARTFGTAYRYFFHKIEGLSAEAVLGYGQWDGSISPHGSDDEITDFSEKLSSSYHASGYFGGVSAAITWLWDSGFYLEWTVVGMTKAKLMTTDFTRESEIVDKAVRRDLQRAAFYGLNNLKIGMLF